MGLFDGDYTITGSYGDTPSTGFEIPSAQNLFPMPSLLTDGQTLIDTRSNVSFWDFDQSKITSKLQDVLGSVTQAAAKSGIQLASDAINRNANNANSSIAGLFRNFQSTQTGTQIQAASLATRAQNMFANPMVWFGVIGLGLFLLLRK